MSETNQPIINSIALVIKNLSEQSKKCEIQYESQIDSLQKQLAQVKQDAKSYLQYFKIRKNKLQSHLVELKVEEALLSEVAANIHCSQWKSHQRKMFETEQELFFVAAKIKELDEDNEGYFENLLSEYLSTRLLESKEDAISLLDEMNPSTPVYDFYTLFESQESLIQLEANFFPISWHIDFLQAIIWKCAFINLENRLLDLQD